MNNRYFFSPTVCAKSNDLSNDRLGSRRHCQQSCETNYKMKNSTQSSQSITVLIEQRKCTSLYWLSAVDKRCFPLLNRQRKVVLEDYGDVIIIIALSHDHFLTWTTSTVAFFCQGIRSQIRTILATIAWARICAITPSRAMTSTTSYRTLTPITPLSVPAIIWKNIIWCGRFLPAMDASVCYGILHFGCVT